MACICGSVSVSASRTTPAGLPAAGSVVKAAYRRTCVMAPPYASTPGGPHPPDLALVRDVGGCQAGGGGDGGGGPVLRVDVGDDGAPPLPPEPGHQPAGRLAGNAPPLP